MHCFPSVVFGVVYYCLVSRVRFVYCLKKLDSCVCARVCVVVFVVVLFRVCVVRFGLFLCVSVCLWFCVRFEASVVNLCALCVVSCVHYLLVFCDVPLIVFGVLISVMFVSCVCFVLCCVVCVGICVCVLSIAHVWLCLFSLFSFVCGSMFVVLVCVFCLYVLFVCVFWCAFPMFCVWRCLFLSNSVCVSFCFLCCGCTCFVLCVVLCCRCALRVVVCCLCVCVHALRSAVSLSCLVSCVRLFCVFCFGGGVCVRFVCYVVRVCIVFALCAIV